MANGMVNGSIAISHQPLAFSPGGVLPSLPDLQSDEPGDREVRTERLAGFGNDLLDLRFRLADDRLLLEQDHLLIEAPELAFDDLVDDVRWLARALHLRPVDPALLVDDV